MSIYTYIACKLETVNYLRSFHIALQCFCAHFNSALLLIADVAFGLVLSENISRQPFGNDIYLAALMEITKKKNKRRYFSFR